MAGLQSVFLTWSSGMLTLLQHLRASRWCAAFGALSPELEWDAIPSLRSCRRLTGVTESQPILGWLIRFNLPLEL